MVECTQKGWLPKIVSLVGNMKTIDLGGFNHIHNPQDRSSCHEFSISFQEMVRPSASFKYTNSPRALRKSFIQCLGWTKKKIEFRCTLNSVALSDSVFLSFPFIPVIDLSIALCFLASPKSWHLVSAQVWVLSVRTGSSQLSKILFFKYCKKFPLKKVFWF